MTIYDALFDMQSIPKKNMNEHNNPKVASFIRYINKWIEWCAKDYINHCNCKNKREETMDDEQMARLNFVSLETNERLEMLETMSLVINKIAELKKVEQQIYICLYQLDWNVSQTADALGFSESYVCRLNRSIIYKLGLTLKGKR